MRVESCGRILAIKYAIDLSLQDVARDIKLLANSYVFDTSKKGIVQYLAGNGCALCRHIIEDMTSLIEQIDVLISLPNQDHLLLMFADMIHEISENKDKAVEEVKHSFKLNTEQDRNYAKMLAQKLDDRMTRIAEGLKRRIPIIKPHCSPEFLEASKEALSSDIRARRADLSKMKLFIFAHSPMAEKYGLTSIDILQKLLERPAMREKLTTVINAIDRGKTPKDGPAILEEAAIIAKQMQMNKPSGVHELPEEEFHVAKNVFLDPGEAWSKEMQARKQEVAEERADEPEDVFDEETLQRKIDERDKQHREGRNFLLDQLLRINT